MKDEEGDPSILVEVQKAIDIEEIPPADAFSAWAERAVRACGRALPARQHLVTIRIVDESESTRLNSSFRNVSRPTNVLAFPAPAALFQADPEDEAELGDLVICAPVVLREAAEQAKQPIAHFAHMTVHGVLHLVGYDHDSPDEAGEMESLEASVLTGLGYPDPYREQNDEQ